MSRIVFLLVFYSIQVHSVYCFETLKINIKVNSSSGEPYCESEQGGVVDLLPWDMLVMRSDVLKLVDVDVCTYEANREDFFFWFECCGHNTFYAIMFYDYFATIEPRALARKYTCNFAIELQDNTTIRSTKVETGEQYSFRNCSLHVNLQGKFWYSGLDPNRRRIAVLEDRTEYEYIFELGEELNISCCHVGNETKHFRFHDSMSLQDTVLDSPFERNATSALNSSLLTCSLYNGPVIEYTIVLYLYSKSNDDDGIVIDPALIDKEGSTYFSTT